jgi:hypothetical protein
MGSGYKAFTAGAVLTASDVNNYLMEQGVMYFATTAARDAALAGSLEDGMTVYIGSNNSSEGFYTYNGSSWRKGPGWNAPWGVLGHAKITTATNATTATTVTGSTLDLTVVANRIYKHTVSGHQFFASINDGMRVSITNGTGTVQMSQDLLPIGGNTTNAHGFSFSWYEVFATSGAITRELRVSRFLGSSGNVTFFADTSRVGSYVIEDIGPDGAPV